MTSVQSDTIFSQENLYNKDFRWMLAQQLRRGNHSSSPRASWTRLGRGITGWQELIIEVWSAPFIANMLYFAGGRPALGKCFYHSLSRQNICSGYGYRESRISRECCGAAMSGKSRNGNTSHPAPPHVPIIHRIAVPRDITKHGDPNGSSQSF